MFFLTSFIHCIFLAIFFFFGRYIEMGVIFCIWLFFVIKVSPPIQIKREVLTEKIKKSQSHTFERSLYLSSGLLFYTALIGVALGIANILSLPVDLELLYYCTFFLTSVIYGLYIVMYPNNPNIFTIFRIHTTIAGSILSMIILATVLFDVYILTFWLLVNIFFLTLGSLVVIILERKIELGFHIASVYFFLVNILSLILGLASLAGKGVDFLLFIIILALSTLYFIFPYLVEKMYLQERAISIHWHCINCLLGLSWLVFGYEFFLLIGEKQPVLYTFLHLFLLFLFWLLVYIQYESELFFSGMVLVVSTFVFYSIFEILPDIFWVSALVLYIFGGLLIVASRTFRGRSEELILATGSILFLCACDIKLILMNQSLSSLLSIALLFLFQSLLWYIAYEIFHRHTHVKNSSL